MADKELVTNEEAEERVIKIVKEGQDSLKADIEKWGKKTAAFEEKINNMTESLENIETENERNIRQLKEAEEKRIEELTGLSKKELEQLREEAGKSNLAIEELKKIIVELKKPEALLAGNSKEAKQQIEEACFNEFKIHLLGIMQKNGNTNAAKHIAAYESNRENNKAAYERFLQERKAYDVRMPAEMEQKYSANNYAGLGAFIMPYTIMNDILDTNVQELSPIRQLARVESIMGPGVEQPVKTAHVQAYRSGELQTRNRDNSYKAGERKIKAHELFVLYAMSFELLEDSRFDLAGEFRREVAQAIAVKEGTESITGTGVGQFKGLGTAAANGDISYKPTGAAGDITDPDYLIEAKYNLKDIYQGNFSWITRRANIPKFLSLKSGNGEYYGNASFVLTFDPQTRRLLILGDPVYMHPDVAAFGADAFVAYYGDFQRGYKIVDKTTDVTIIEDIYSAKTSGEVEILIRIRSGADVVSEEAVNALKASVS